MLIRKVKAVLVTPLKLLAVRWCFFPRVAIPFQLAFFLRKLQITLELGKLSVPRSEWSTSSGWTKFFSSPHGSEDFVSQNGGALT
jgi:hypothetical protein